ncbi:lysis protein [Klebsiella sp. BIGb0407]|uniref:lysis protein n=1 Tax=Klebsiella sp. BIGb0407 TaxID=2940603 RepID=UPI00216989D0|nr:lysis protein [Klebsiella sp. BIGb0407]MCS3433688.1 prophage endopeptidase [Klebsiella sp. BIGb0407]
MKWYHLASIALLVCFAGGLIYSANHYSGLYESQKQETKSEKKRADDAESLAQQRLDTINDMQVRQRNVAALDAKYTGELADARSENERLRADIATGKRKLQLNATCSKGDSSTASSLGDGESPRLTVDAELNYFRLRDGIATITKQVNYLQDYIRQQCLK